MIYAAIIACGVAAYAVYRAITPSAAEPAEPVLIRHGDGRVTEVDVVSGQVRLVEW